jgi:hypothetical protein
MTASYGTTFDPNFEALLREAAAAPRSLLLRVERPQILPTLRSREAPVSVAMAGLSSVERELLASYRSELGLLLRQAALHELRTNEASGPWIDGTISDHRMHERHDEAAWRQAAAEHLSEAIGASDDDTKCGHALVRQLLGAADHVASTPQIAAACLRVELRDEPRVYTAAHFAAKAELATCQAVIRTCLDGAASVPNQVYALEVSALAQGRAGRFAVAAEILSRASQLGFPRGEVPLRWFLYSALAGNQHSVRAAMVHIQETVLPNNPAVENVCADVREQVRYGAWELAAGVRASLEVLSQDADPITRKLLYALSN